jgi:GT2 family glycosyltransferase
VEVRLANGETKPGVDDAALRSVSEPASERFLAIPPSHRDEAWMKLAIVIVNYCTPKLTVDCVQSLHEARDLPSGTKVVVVDGKSPDDSVRVIAEAIARHGWADWVTLLPLDVNGGFAYANNRAIEAVAARAGRPEFVWLLNADTEVRPGAASALLSLMEAHPRAGIAGSRLEDPDGTPQSCAFRFHSVPGEFEGTIRLGLVSRILRRQRMSPPVPDVPVRMDWVSGASIFIRSEALNEVGLLDEAYFMYYEEADFCLRASRAGWECWHVPASRVVHFVGQSSGVTVRNVRPRRLPAYWFESRRRYFLKNYGSYYAALADLAWMTGYVLWYIRRALLNRPNTDPPMLLYDFLRYSVLSPLGYRRKR